jgi:hypothetical protein
MVRGQHHCQREKAKEATLAPMKELELVDKASKAIMTVFNFFSRRIMTSTH